ncbi:hypothetical protein, partial [Klebsiella quasipneumoniae]|uniref:hypothetical protein n=1 Tax=Klebsiella quasipneumoniae TaxID=1463165 RepID=UPI0018A27A16
MNISGITPLATNALHRRRLIATTAAGMAALCLSACGGTPPPALNADETAHRFTAWLAENTYDYVSVEDVRCGETRSSSDDSYRHLASCAFTATLAPNTVFPKDNPLGFTGPSEYPTTLHDMDCELRISESLDIDSALCPTVIGWIFS